MTKEEVQKQVESATRLVSTWPQWKRNILIQSAQPTVSEPRTPVNNQAGRAEEKSN